MAPNPKSSASVPSTPRSAALALLSRRDYTSTELESRLIDKGFDQDAARAAIADLRARRIVDDARVAAAHVRTAGRVKGRGRLRIARELKARGLSRDMVDEALRAVEPGDELAAIRKILDRKRWPAHPTRAERQKMYRHLMGRGFPSDLISKALGGRFDNDEE